jgi:hypothetical protein
VTIENDKLIRNLEASLSLLYTEYTKLPSDKDIFFVHDEIFDTIETIKETIALLENNAILIEDILSPKQR